MSLQACKGLKAQRTSRLCDVFDSDRETVEWTAFFQWDLIHPSSLFDDKVGVKICPCLDGMIPFPNPGKQELSILFHTNRSTSDQSKRFTAREARKVDH
jgi:hypothetical protein